MLDHVSMPVPRAESELVAEQQHDGIPHLEAGPDARDRFCQRANQELGGLLDAAWHKPLTCGQ